MQLRFALHERLLGDLDDQAREVARRSSMRSVRSSRRTGADRLTAMRVCTGRTASSSSAARRQARSSASRSPNSSASENQCSGAVGPALPKRASAS